MNTIRAWLFFTICSLVAGCKLALIVPSGGDVVSESQLNNCAGGQICEFEIHDATFDETFTAQPREGYVFSNWEEGLDGERFRCRGSTDPVCRVRNTQLAPVASLIPVSEYGAIYYLLPRFEFVGIDTDNDGVKNFMDDDDDNDGVLDVDDDCPLDDVNDDGFGCPIVYANTTVFFEDFEDDVTGNNPVINNSAGNIGSTWDNEVSPGVTVSTNPNLTGNTSATVLKLHHRGQMSGNFVSGVPFNGASISMDFYVASADGLTGNNNAKKVGLKSLRADNTTPWGLNLRLDGAVGGGLFATSHYGSGIWQNATWGFTYIGGDDWEVDLTFTNLNTGASTVTEIQTMALGAAVNTEIFTAIGSRGQGPDPFEGYVDNIAVTSRQVQ